MSRPSSVSAWGAVRTVPKRTTPLVRQQHLWRPRPSVPRCVRCCLELLPFQCSRCGGDYWVSHSECLTWYLKEILFALLSRPTTAAGTMGTRPWSTTSAITQNRRLVPTDKQNGFPRHCLISQASSGHRRHYRRTHQDETLVNTGCSISPRC